MQFVLGMGRPAVRTKRVGQDEAGKIGGKHTEKGFHSLDIFLKEVEALPEYL